MSRRQDHRPASRPGTCQFIEGEPSRDDACKCGRPVHRAGSPWCAEHYRRVYVRRDERDHDDDQGEAEPAARAA
jgi:hypothetical protein